MRILLLLVLIFPSQLNAEPIVNEKVKEYHVYFNNVDTLLSDIDKASPIRQDGSIYHAHTDTYVKWNYWWDSSEKSCTFNRVQTTVDITYTLPLLRKSSASKQVLDIWRLYYPALVQHEKGHGEIAINAAREIEKTLIQMPSYNNCDSLSQKANLKAQDILARFRPKHMDYDKITEHGKTEGANIKLYLR
jgi:predicted secreted Zn-dependent protease